jgi:hypothetical protein
LLGFLLSYLYIAQTFGPDCSIALCFADECSSLDVLRTLADFSEYSAPFVHRLIWLALFMVLITEVVSRTFITQSPCA